MTPIPFSIDLWQQGYRPVTRDGREVTEFKDSQYPPFRLEGKVDGQDQSWREDGTWRIKRGVEHPLDLFLLPPEDEMNEIVVEVEFMHKNSFEKMTILRTVAFDYNKVPPGKYRLTKIE
jgi:hypothetical protein